MGFPKEKIDAAKQGEHLIAWGPGQKADRVRCIQVRGDRVRVEVLEGPEKGARPWLNGTASEYLIKGRYRAS